VFSLVAILLLIELKLTKEKNPCVVWRILPSADAVYWLDETHHMALDTHHQADF
jgi:hypothetical protein